MKKNEAKGEKNMYKIILINSMINSGGTERVVANLSNEWCKRDQVEIIVTTESVKSFYELDSNIKITSLNIRPYNANPISIVIWLYNITRKLYMHLKDKKPDVVLGIWTSMAICTVIAGKFANVKSVACEHISYDLTKATLKMLRRVIYPFATSVVTLTDRDKKRFERYCKKVECIENAISFTSSKWPQYDRKTVLAVGRIVEQKGFDLLLKAWDKAVNKNNDWKLIVLGGTLGDDEYSCKLKRIIKENNLSSSIEIHPPSKNIMEYFLNASIFVLSSRYEGLPMVMIEAMGIGLPIVSFDCPTGPKEIIAHNVNGFLVPYLDIEAMQDKLNILMKDEALREKFGMKSREIAMNKYSTVAVEKKWDRLFNNLLNGE